MEALTGRDDGGVREETGSSSSRSYNISVSGSSRSGTIVSSTTAYSSSASRCSSTSTTTLLQLELLQTDKKDTDFVQQKKRMRHIERLVREFFRRDDASSENNHSILCGGVMERWFSEMGVRWVLLLHLDDYASATVLGQRSRSWILALEEIVDTIRLTASLFPFPDQAVHGSVVLGMPGISEEEVDDVEPPPPPAAAAAATTTNLNPLQFALFFREAMAKILFFVDVLFSKSLFILEAPNTSDSLASYLNVHSALSTELSGFRFQLHYLTPSIQVEKIEREMLSLLSVKQEKAAEGIWSALQEIRTRVLESMEDYSSSGTQTPQGSLSSDIHEATYLVMNHINFLQDNHNLLTPLVSQAVNLGKYVPQAGMTEAPPLISLITETVSCIEEKLITLSQSFLDKGLRFLFLLNNLNFIWSKLKYTESYVNVNVPAVTRRAEQYIESYIEVSWTPMLSCLFNPTPLRLVRKYSPLSKFESKFQKTYTTQKLWKVPDPKLRRKLRKAVIGKIIPGYTKYIEDSKVNNPKFTSQELEEMLQELFEG